MNEELVRGCHRFLSIITVSLTWPTHTHCCIHTHTPTHHSLTNPLHPTPPGTWQCKDMCTGAVGEFAPVIFAVAKAKTLDPEVVRCNALVFGIG